MVCGRFHVLQSAHSCFACVYSQVATTTYVTPKHIVTVRYVFIIHLYFSSEASGCLKVTEYLMLKLSDEKVLKLQ